MANLLPVVNLKKITCYERAKKLAKFDHTD